MRRICSAALLIALLMTLTSCGSDETDRWQEQYDLGLQYLSEENYEEAILAFRAAIEIDPKRAEAYLSLADAYIATGEYDEAREVLEEALEQADSPEAVRGKLEEIDSLISRGEDRLPEAEGGDPAQTDPPGPSAEPAPEPGEPAEGTGDNPDDPRDEEANQPPTEEPSGEAGTEEPVQLPERYREYRYAVDMVGSATLWDAYKTIETEGGYRLMYWDTIDGASIYISLASEGWERYFNFWCSVPEEMQGMEGVAGDVTAEEMLGLCSGSVIYSVDGRYGSPGIEVSPVFPNGMTSEEIIQACEANGYSYTVQENPAYSETYLHVDLGGSTALSFTWDTMDVTGVSPAFFTVSQVVE